MKVKFDQLNAVYLKYCPATWADWKMSGRGTVVCLFSCVDASVVTIRHGKQKV